MAKCRRERFVSKRVKANAEPSIYKLEKCYDMDAPCFSLDDIVCVFIVHIMVQGFKI